MFVRSIEPLSEARKVRYSYTFALILDRNNNRTLSQSSADSHKRR